MEKYAYIRVSTKEQNIDRQLVALKPYGIPEQNIYCDYQSGKDFDRPAYKKLLGKFSGRTSQKTSARIFLCLIWNFLTQEKRMAH